MSDLGPMPTAAEIRAKANALRDAWARREGHTLCPLQELIPDHQDIWLRAAESAILAERAAVLAEREACAQLVNDMGARVPGASVGAHALADAIRARR